MYPILFSVGGVNFYTHGLMIAIGSLMGGFIIFYLAKKKSLPTKFLFDLLVFSLFAGVVGGRITYIILYYYQFENWHEMFFIWYGGLVSYGGIIFGLLAAGLILRKRKQNILEWFDIGIIGLLLGWAFGRVGCLLSGDVPGVYSSSRLTIGGSIPVSLFEAVWSFILAGIFFYLYRFQRNFIQKWPDGFIFFSGAALYVLGRFFIDFFRQEEILYLVNGSQAASFGLFIVLILILFFKYFSFKSGNLRGSGKERQNA